MKNRQKGFTLVELMIVVAIIGILAAIAIPKFADMLEKSREGATKGNLSAINSGIALYVSDNQGITPNSLNLSSITIGGVLYPAFVPTYMDNIPGVKATAARKKALAAWGGATATSWSSPAGATVFSTLATVAVPGGAGLGGTGWLYAPGVAAGSDFWVNSLAGDMKSYANAGGSSMIYQYTLYGYE